MKKTSLDLLNEVVKMGFTREYALESIDVALDEKFENRKELSEEYLNNETYENIIDSFKCELEYINPNAQKETSSKLQNWKIEEIKKNEINEKTKNEKQIQEKEELAMNASWLKGFRYNYNLTQKELAQKAGISKATIENIEQEKRKGSKETWEKLKKFSEKLKKED